MDLSSLPKGTEATEDFAQAADARDLDKYRHHLDGMELTDAQATELLTILHGIMSRFVFLGWDVNLVCEYVFGEDASSPKNGSDSL